MLPRVAQPVKRESSAAKMPYIPVAIAAITIIPANISGVLKFELATSIRFPMPSLPATVSAMTAPTKASVMAIFNDALLDFPPDWPYD